MANEVYDSLPEDMLEVEPPINAVVASEVEGRDAKDSSEAGLVRIISLLPNPVGRDSGNETVTLVATGDKVDITGWSLVDKNGGRFVLNGFVDSSERVITLEAKVRLSNNGSTVKLEDAQKALVHEVSYGKEDVRQGQEIRFSMEAKAL
ncbi:hypothetical protein BWQ96_04198 [Gracilariopsis chorda]|uniref:LTD domain-containing protein n=1 Tax=Gracilariopsis chorda TaxID=448386 RepID=A0A2V3IVB3_9FLOR|nr:hypothetical protein BWQ96_04198 [Gracilariopsis chorda]|eukprot:PXF46023.1 hypothetical protein BWQ96_04198 [Gracilariopsis chorda]